MKTAEEILKSKLNTIYLPVVQFENILDAMEEYANQNKPDAVCGKCGSKEGLVLRCAECIETYLMEMD